MKMVPLSRFGAVLFAMIALGNLATVQGQRASAQRGVQVTTPDQPAKPSLPSPIGPYYALVIGNNNYKNLNKLKTAVNDAKAMGQLLHDRFGFQTKILYDATRANILDALDDYQRSLPEKSNLLIYYAGHGHKDVAAQRAYWLPVDAQRDHSPNWISSTEITDKLRAIPSRHILVIADSCWSGDLAMSSVLARASGGGPVARYEHDAMVVKMLNLKSRHIMSSGGDEPVADNGAAGHSVFSAALLQSLSDMERDNFTAEDLLVERVKPRVAGRSQQVPEYASLRETYAALGDFVFFRSKSQETQNALSDLLHDLPSGNPAGGYGEFIWLVDRRGEILRRAKTLFVSAPLVFLFPSGTQVKNSDLRKSLAANQAFKTLNIKLVDDRKTADVVLVMDALHPSNSGSMLPGKQNDNVIFWLTVADKNFYIDYANVPEGRSDNEQAGNLVQETAKLLQDVKAVPWSANK